MKTSHVIIGMVLGTLAGLFCLTNAKAQTQEYDNDVTFAERNLSGPRLGVTYLPGSSSLAQKLRDKGIGTTISQFGWHFEYQVIPEGGGPSFVIQGIPLVGGVEYGTLIPSMTVAMGIRIPEGVEFGLGPNLILSDRGGMTSLVMSVGKSFNYGGVSIPLNFVFATNPDGNRFSIIFGYAISRAAK